jgi:hypothetical protein
VVIFRWIVIWYFFNVSFSLLLRLLWLWLNTCYHVIIYFAHILLAAFVSASFLAEEKKQSYKVREKASSIKHITTIPLVYLKVFGGLGNQLFEYSCAYWSLAKKNDWALHVHIPINTQIDNSNLLRKDWLGSVDKRHYNPADRSFALQYFSNIHLKLSALLDNYLSSHHQVVQSSDRDILYGKYPVSWCW